MSYVARYPQDEDEPTRAAVEALAGLTVLEFGAGWCGWCQGAQPATERALSEHREIRHIKVSDGKGKPLGRSFRVKLWPTLVVLRDGLEVARVVRPQHADEVRAALQAA
jgi:thioredoxin 1